MIASLFVTMATTGGSAFEEYWPHLLTPAVVFTLLAVCSAVHARRNPDTWIHRSRWPVGTAAVLLATLVAVVVFGTLA